MPKLSEWSIKMALIYFFIGITFGSLMLTSKVIPIHPAIWALFPMHIELLLFGWVISLIIGVSFWILPRFPGNNRGNEPLAWMAFLALNSGILSVITGYSAKIIFLLTLGRFLEFLAVTFYSIFIWNRIRPTRKGYQRRTK